MGTAMTKRQLRCGDRITEINGRHIGRVEAINNGHARIRWEDNPNWTSDLPSDDIEVHMPIRWDADLGRHVRED